MRALSVILAILIVSTGGKRALASSEAKAPAAADGAQLDAVHQAGPSMDEFQGAVAAKRAARAVLGLHEGESLAPSGTEMTGGELIFSSVSQAVDLTTVPSRLTGNGDDGPSIVLPAPTASTGCSASAETLAKQELER